MTGKLIATGKELYYQDRLWQLLIQIITSSLLALILVTFCQFLLGNHPGTTGRKQVSASYKPVVPPKAFSHSGLPSGQVINMPISAEDIESDDRLKDLQISAQSIDHTLPEAQQCEQYVSIMAPITSYDKKRAKPVHRRIMSDAQRCKIQITKSDQRLRDLESAGDAYQEKVSVDNAIHLVRAASAITSYDQHRTRFRSSQDYLDFVDDAEKIKKDSDDRLSALKLAYHQFRYSPSLKSEILVINADKALLSSDRERDLDKADRFVIVSSDKVASDYLHRIDELNRLHSLLVKIEQKSDEANETSTEQILVELTDRLGKVNPVLLSVDEETLLAKAKTISFSFQKQKLENLVNQFKKDKDVAWLEPIAKQYTQLRDNYSGRLFQFNSDVISISKNALSKVNASDIRLKKLIVSAEELKKKMTQKTILKLQRARQALNAVDMIRLTEVHKRALALAKKASSGVLESDQRIRRFVLAFNKYRQQGCTKTTLRTLRQTKESLTELDIERSSQGVKKAVKSSESYLSRNYCVSTSISPLIKPI